MKKKDEPPIQTRIQQARERLATKVNDPNLQLVTIEEIDEMRRRLAKGLPPETLDS